MSLIDSLKERLLGGVIQSQVAKAVRKGLRAAAIALLGLSGVDSRSVMTTEGAILAVLVGLLEALRTTIKARYGDKLPALIRAIL